MTAVDAEWDEYSDGSGLRYEVYTRLGPYGQKHTGDLNRIAYGPPGGDPEHRLVAAAGCYSDCAHSEPPCEAAWRPYASAIFLGTPIDIKNMTRASDRVQRLTATLRIDEAFRGVKGGTVTVVTGGANCGFPFSTKLQYLVYATRQRDGQLSVDLCGATKWASEAASDLAYLRQQPVAAAGGVISGSVYRYAGPPPREKVARLMRAVAGQVVRVRGSQTYAVKTDIRGRFEVRGVKPGGYEIGVDVKDPVSPNPIQFVQVFGSSCAEAIFRLDPY